MPWTPKYPMGLTQVPKPMALTPFVMLIFQCFVASSLGQSMPHSCSFRHPICFPFSISGYMPATKIKSSVLSDSMPLLIIHTTVSIYFDLKVHWDQIPNHKTIQAIEHSATACLLLLPLISYPKSGSLNNKYEYRSTSQSTARKSPANVRTPSITSSEPLPKRPENQGHGRSCRSHPPRSPEAPP